MGKLFGITWGKDAQAERKTGIPAYDVPDAPEPENEVEEPRQFNHRRAPQSNVYTPAPIASPYSSGVVFSVFDGEKTIGGMGPAKIYTKDYYKLRVRSKQLYLESDICRAAVDAYAKWVIGRGFKLKAEPLTDYLKKKDIKIESEQFNSDMEDLVKLYTQGTECDYCGQNNLNQLRAQTFMEGKLCGDILVILRVVGDTVKIQLIDSTFVSNPPYANTVANDGTLQSYADYAGYDYIYPETKNRIRQGVEYDKKDEVVAYHIRTGIGLEYERIQRRDSMGFLRAYMYYGKKENVGDFRGTPLLTVVMERAKQLDGYLLATLTGAEERAKIAYTFEHGTNSNQEDPLAARRAKAQIAQPVPNASGAISDLGIDVLGNKIASDFTASTNKTVVNLPNDVSAKSLESKQEVHVAEFTTAISDLICAALNIPPDVVFKKYVGSFSSARMGGQDWQHTFLTEREDFIQQFDTPIYALQFYLWVLSGEVKAPGYIEAVQRKDWKVVESYVSAKWTGNLFPDVDLLKTVNYIREALGVAFEHVPLMTAERASEIIDSANGSLQDILKQAGLELKDTAANDIELPADNMISPQRAVKPTQGDTKRDVDKR